jgi:hypothetical protein
MKEKITLAKIPIIGLMKINSLGIGSKNIEANRKLAINHLMTSPTARIKITSMEVLLILFSERRYLV